VSPAQPVGRAGDVSPDNESFLEDKAKFTAAIGATLVPFLTFIPEVGKFVEKQREENPTAFDITSTLGQIGTSFIGGIGILSKAGWTVGKIADKISKSGKALNILNKAKIGAEGGALAVRNVAEGLLQEAIFSMQRGEMPKPQELAIFTAVDAVLPNAFRSINALRRGVAKKGAKALEDFDTKELGSAAGRADFATAPPSGFKADPAGRVQPQSAGMFHIHPDTAKKFKQLDHDNFSTLESEWNAVLNSHGVEISKVRGATQDFDTLLKDAEQHKGLVHQAMRHGEVDIALNKATPAKILALRQGTNLMANMLAKNSSLKHSEAFMSRFRNIATVTLGSATHTGRTLRSYAVRFGFDDATAGSLEKLLAEEDQILAAIKLIDKSSDPTQIDKLMKKVAEIGRNAKLWSPGTVVRSFMGNAINNIMAFADTITGVSYDAMRSVLTGKARSRTMKELTARYLGFKSSFHEAWAMVPKILHEDPEALAKAGYIQAETGKLAGEVAGKKGKILRLGQNMQGIIDILFRIPTVKAEAMQAATRRAFEEIQSGALDASKLRKRTEELAEEWLKPGSTHRKRFEAAASRLVFQAPIENRVGKAIQDIRTGEGSGAAIAQIFLPFFRTGFNIGKETIERTPFTFLSKATRNTWKLPRGKEDVLVKMANGTALIGVTGAVLGSRVSGSGPKDPGERAQLFESGWQPNSIKATDNTYISYEGFGPISVLMGMTANAMEGKDPGDAGARAIDTILKETAFYNIQEMMEVMSPRSRKDLSSWSARMMAGMVIPSIARQIGIVQYGGQLQRRGDGLMENLQAEFGNVPGFGAARLDPRISPLGRTAVQQNPLARMFGVKVSQENQNAIAAQELNRLGVVIGNPTRLFDVKLNKDQQNQLNATAGPQINSALTVIINSPAYQQADDAMKTEVLERFKSTLVNKARKFFAGDIL
jgi:hypothetical protein